MLSRKSKLLNNLSGRVNPTQHAIRNLIHSQVRQCVACDCWCKRSCNKEVGTGGHPPHNRFCVSCDFLRLPTNLCTATRAQASFAALLGTTPFGSIGDVAFKSDSKLRELRRNAQTHRTHAELTAVGGLEPAASLERSISIRVSPFLLSKRKRIDPQRSHPMVWRINRSGETAKQNRANRWAFGSTWKRME